MVVFGDYLLPQKHSRHLLYGVCMVRRVHAYNLRNVVRSLSLRNTCRYVVQVGSGAEHMHDNGFCHGDIKPENILMFDGNDGSLVPKLADFGTTRGESLLLCMLDILRGNFTKSTLKRRALRCQSVATLAIQIPVLRRPLTRCSFWSRLYHTLSCRVHALRGKTSGLTPVLTCLPARDFP